jgi:hypothetical protein
MPSAISLLLRRNYIQRLCALTGLLTVASCSVYKSDGPEDELLDKNGRAVTRRDGQPYFLPKALVRLTIKPEKAGEAAAKKEGQKALLGAAIKALPAADGLAPGVQLYTITVEKKIVPDRSAGPFYAHYSPNWAYKDIAGVKVGDNQLLSSVSATVEDRTKTSLDNLADATIDVLKFQAAGGLGAAAAVPSVLGSFGKSTRARKPAVQPPYIKQLDIDVTFDPFDKADRDRVDALFADDTDGARAVFSPLKIKFEFEGDGKGTVLPAKRASRDGLWFREPTTFEVVIEHNPALAKYMKPLLKAAHQEWVDGGADLQEEKRLDRDLKEQLDAAVLNHAEAKASLTKYIAELDDLQKKTPPASAADLEQAKTNVRTAQKDVAELQGQVIRAKAASKKKADEFADLQESYTFEGQYVTQLEKMHFGSLPGEKARDSRLTLAVPNQNRAFAVNLPRSAFITRTTKLTVDSGILLGVEHDKPSEVEGFTEIPKSLAAKLASIPKALVDTKTTIFGSQTAAINAAKGREDAAIALGKVRATKDVVIETEELTQQDAYLKKKVTVLQSEADVRAKEKEIFQKSLPEIQSEKDKLDAAKSVEDSRKALLAAETARLTEEKNRLKAERELAEEKKKGVPATPTPPPTGPGNATDPNKPAGNGG